MKSSKNEKEILDAFENGSLKSISNVKNEIERHREYARNTILLSEDSSKVSKKTLNLLSAPKMRESIIRGLKTPVKKCKSDLKW